ncbi:MAG: glycosyltransferase family 39 protein [Candidatus Omnitrophica bacterium]|nr:glycosyltransferase family 39 protein [Candidatus Omnitrophota bacterium]
MLNEKQKEFILKSHKTTSVRQIAKFLNIRRNDVSDFIKTLEKAPSPSIFSKHKKILIPFSILILFIVHFALRYNTFWLSHVPGDQNQYIGLAMKLQKKGFEEYNLRGIDLKPIDEKIDIFSLSLSKDQEGSLMKGLKNSGVGYYDMPFFYKGPAFPIALAISHQIFRHDKDYLLVWPNLGKQVYKKKPKHFFSLQFYAVIVPLFFSTVLMLLTFYLGQLLFSHRVGFYAAFMLAVNPISILTAHKIWADDMLSAFVTLSVLLFLLAQKKDRLWLSFLGGISCGVAVLAKQNGGIIFAGLIAYSILIKGTFKHLISYFVGLMLLTAPWFYKVYSIYGSPIYSPPHPDLLKTDPTGWFKRVGSRPRPYILFPVGIPYLCPPFILAYATLKKFVLRLRLWNPLEKNNQEGNNIVLLWFWILPFILFLIFYGGGDEHRRMLPAYPAIAIASAYILNKSRIFIDKNFNIILAESLVFAVLIASAFWSVPIGLETVLANDAIITKPF